MIRPDHMDFGWSHRWRPQWSIFPRDGFVVTVFCLWKARCSAFAAPLLKPLSKNDRKKSCWSWECLWCPTTGLSAFDFSGTPSSSVPWLISRRVRTMPFSRPAKIRCWRREAAAGLPFT
uniref:(northern house mosquito) hypothetical protein n=1 Tax=Culex pipiens TaxID=7175 RepID=A0A8D8MF15_CULPI